jgi:hypothetical protein
MKGDNNANISSKIIGSSLSGVLEIGLFHPVDTVAKRLMYNKKSINGNLNKVIFNDYHNHNFINKYKSLYTGAHFAIGYKILQRTYKYGGQSILNDLIIKKNDNKNKKIMVQSMSGALIGAGEVILLPLDVLKIKMQTNPDSIKNNGFLKIIKQEGMNLYRGTGMTIVRNVPGSFALFGGNSFTKEKIFNLEDSSKATFFQNFVSSTIGALCSISVSSPMDVIKTRIQADNNMGNARTIVKDLIKNEGMGAFFKGLGPKLLIIGPKLTFSFTVAQYLIQKIDNKCM